MGAGILCRWWDALHFLGIGGRMSLCGFRKYALHFPTYGLAFGDEHLSIF